MHNVSKEQNPKRTLPLVLALLGFTAVIAQVLLMRELLVTFYGNELALGVMLANWLLWTALGAACLDRGFRSTPPRRLVAWLQVLLAVTLPLTVLAVRASRSFFHSLPGEILGPLPMFLTSGVTLSLFCVLSGGLFAAGSRLWAEQSHDSVSRATGAAYLFEAAGSGAGGLLMGLALVRVENPFWIIGMVGVLNLVAAWLLLDRQTHRRHAFTLGFAVLAVLVAISGYWLQPLSLARLWEGFRLVATRNSFYGSLAVTETGDSRSLFENGLIMMTVPDPAAAEEAVHFALLEHPAPQRVLLIGGGVNGSVSQALAHPTVQHLDYVELDPMIFAMAERYFFDTLAHRGAAVETGHPHFGEVQTHAVDGRRFLKGNAEKFDVIIINLPDPHTAQINRFYTQEFYREAAAKLAPGGVLSFQVTSSENYISPELANFLRCLNSTLRTVFPEVVAIPGETVHFFAATTRGTLTTDPHELVRRLQARGLHPQYVREDMLPFRMSPDRMQDLQFQIAPLATTPVNHDFAPVAYYFDVALWSTRFQPGSGRWIEALAGVRFRWILAGTLLAIGLMTLLLWIWPARDGEEMTTGTRRSAALAVVAVGFTELGLEILLLLGFQSLYGYVYHELTILVALFMVGMAVGGWWGLRMPTSRDGHSELRVLAAGQLLLALAPLALCGLLVQLGRLSSVVAQQAASNLLFPALALVAGLVGGFQFLIASRVYFADESRKPDRAEGSPGVLYALDLTGASLGALALSLLLIPVYGFFRTATLMAAVNLIPAVMAAFAGRTDTTLRSKSPGA